MDVLTSAASAHEAASETHSSGETSQISSEAQILALKRKLIECDQESRDQRERIAGLEKALEKAQGHISAKEDELAAPENASKGYTVLAKMQEEVDALRLQMAQDEERWLELAERDA